MIEDHLHSATGHVEGPTDLVRTRYVKACVPKRLDVSLVNGIGKPAIWPEGEIDLGLERAEITRWSRIHFPIGPGPKSLAENAVGVGPGSIMVELLSSPCNVCVENR